jgi:sporadic carbohydrate cluster 2OG-Fe(II) oxygenase
MKKKLKLFKQGFEIKKFNFKEIKTIKFLKSKLTNYSKKKLNTKGKLKLENIHQVDVENFNDYRIDVISFLNSIPGIRKKLFNILEKHLVELFGKDISMQKYINLSIQRPLDFERTPMHSDAPSHSLYEVAIWLPLVNCKRTMGMYYFPINKTTQARKFVLNCNSKNPDKFSKKNGIIPNVRFGEFVIFWTKCFHYIPVNQENVSRWSLNFRYKNTFSPYSKKGYLDSYEPVSYSDITEMVLSNEQKKQ